MLFKSFGVAVATNLSSPSDEAKPITLRFPESEIALYDVLAKTMGLTRQDFFQHLIRSCYRDAFKQFADGYCESNPSITLQEVMDSHTSSDDLKNRIDSMLYWISSDLHSQEQIAYEEQISSSTVSREYLAREVKGILLPHGAGHL
jgi:hypothetical protein